MFMVVVLFVTGDACDRGILERAGEMAFLAGCRGVQANQWKACQIVLECDAIPPALLLMAGITLLSLLSIVNVITTVTGIALDLELFVIDLSFVAGPALKVRVPSSQGKVCVFLMIELGAGPAGRRVALIAFPAMPVIVGVVVLVAREAVVVPVLVVELAFVTGAAAQFTVAVLQREFRIPVVIEKRGVPVLRCMAAVAALAVIRFVYIVQCMARIALGGRGLIALVGMTTAAGQLLMLVQQGKIRGGMIEL